MDLGREQNTGKRCVGFISAFHGFLVALTNFRYRLLSILGASVRKTRPKLIGLAIYDIRIASSLASKAFLQMQLEFYLLADRNQRQILGIWGGKYQR